MKKLLALLMAMLLMLSMTACSGKVPTGTISGGNNTANNQTATNEDVNTNETPEEEKTEEITFGSTSGSTYVNEAVGLRFTLAEDWTFKTKDELAELTNLTAEALSGDVAEALKNATSVYDMMAVSGDQMNNVLVAFEKLGVVNGLLYDVDSYIEAAIPQIQAQLKNSSTVESIQKASFTIDGEAFTGIKSHYKTSGIDIYQAMVCIKVDNYMVLLTATSYLTDNTANLLGYFEIL